MDYHREIIDAIEMHDLQGIRKCFENGVSPNDLFKGEPLIYELTSEYGRSPLFKDCVKLFIEFGLEFKDKALLAVLADDAGTLANELKTDPSITQKHYSLKAAYTPMYEVSLLHICAEFNHVSCAQLLLDKGVDINVKAGLDGDGFGGHTPIFHTVNQNGNQSADMLELCLSNKADLHHTVAGLIWGNGYSWKTLIPAVNPISYAIMGLLPQMHRNEIVISKTVTRLLREAYNINYLPTNVPCAYLKKNE